MSRGYEKGVLTHSKGRLLAHLVWFGKIKCVPSVPADVMRIIGYKSPGHWSHDVEELVSDGYITVEGGYYKPTAKAMNLLKPIADLKKTALLNIVASGMILLVGVSFYLGGGQTPHFVWNVLIAAYLAIVNLIAVRPFYLLFKKVPREEF